MRVEQFLGCDVSLEFGYFATEAMKDEVVRAGFDAVDIIERDPYAGVEYPSRRAYLFARKGDAPHA